jgi:hypothetical protein
LRDPANLEIKRNIKRKEKRGKRGRKEEGRLAATSNSPECLRNYTVRSTITRPSWLSRKQ